MVIEAISDRSEALARHERLDARLTDIWAGYVPPALPVAEQALALALTEWTPDHRMRWARCVERLTAHPDLDYARMGEIARPLPRVQAELRALYLVDPDRVPWMDRSRVIEETRERRAVPPRSTLDAGLDCIARGWVVVPAKGRAPVEKWDRASRTPAELRAAWDRHPGANVAILTGESGIVVIDLDVKSHGNGYENLRAAERRLEAELPWTACALSGGVGGGAHLYFRAPAVRLATRAPLQLCGVKLEAVDVRAHGGVIIAPGSVHPDTGRVYEWTPGATPDDLPELPPAWVEALTAKNERTERNEVARAKWIADSARSREQTSDVIVRLLREIAFAELGSRNDTLARHAFTLGLIVREGRLDEQRAAAGLEGAISEWPDGERDDRKDLDTAMRQLREGMKT